MPETWHDKYTRQHHKQQDDMVSRQDDMTNNITESQPIETFANANLSVNQMSPIICRWKLVKHLYYFGDNRRTKGIRKIKLCALKVCCMT